MAVGTAIADYRGTLGQAETNTLDLGLIGTALTSEQCDGSAPAVKREQLPQPLIVESDHGNASQSADQLGSTKGGLLAAGGHQVVTATTVPSATADFAGGVLGITGLAEASDLSSAATAALVPGKARIATATATVGRLSLLGGAVVLDGLHWTASHRTGAGAAATGAFTIGDAYVAGRRLPASSGSAQSVLAAVNAALKPSGLHLTVPEPRKTPSGALEIPPLTLGIGNSALGAAIVNPLVTGAQPVLEQVEKALFGISCKFGSGVTVADIALAAIDGTGGLDLKFGGVSVGTDDTTYANPFGPVELGTAAPSLGGGGAPAAIGGTVPGGAGAVPAGPAVASPTAIAPQVANRAQATASCATTSPAHWPSCSNGAGLAVGLLGLAAVLGIGGTDWYVTRRRRRLPVLDL
jgi:hypothetical protein